MNSRHEVGGIALLLGLSTLVGLSIWLSQSDFLPTGLPDSSQSVHYVLCSASPGLLVADFAIVLGALFGAHLALERWGRRRDRIAWWPAVEDVRCFRPLALIGLNLAGLGVLSPRLRDWWGPIAYVAVDLHWLVSAAAIAFFLAEIDKGSGGNIRLAWGRLGDRLDAPSRLLCSDVAVAAAAVAVVVITSPLVRFSPIVIGDEPKYLRYCESWWQGLGVDIEQVRDVAEIPVDEPSHLLRNISMLGPVLRADFASLGADMKYVVRRGFSDHRFNRALYAGGWFIVGKRGGLYQLHNPGVSALILPAYLIDRAWFDTKTSKFPDDLFTVNLTFLTMFALIAVAMFRLGRRIGVGSGASAVAALAIALSLPLAAFAFQFYPEMAAGLVLVLLVNYLVAPPPLRHGSAAIIGCGLGLLGWLHVRFFPLAGIGFAWVAWTHRRDRAHLATVTLVSGAFVAAYCLYAYHITGSLLPTALWEADWVRSQFAWHDVPNGLLQQAFDRKYGLISLAPVFLLSLPGLALMYKREPRALLIILSFGLALSVISAGHGLGIAGTTPGRFILAVTPLAAAPLALWLETIKGRSVALAASAFLILISILNCAAHDWQNTKGFVTLTTSGFSGWNPSLLFPLAYDAAWIPRNFEATAVMAWSAIAVLCVAFGMILTSDQTRGARRSRRASPASLTIRGLVFIAVTGLFAIAIGGSRHQPQFLPDADVLSERAKAIASKNECWIRMGEVPPPESAGS